MCPTTDRELVDAVLAGDKAAFAELVRRYEPLTRAAVIAILHDSHLTQDVLQDSFLQAYKKLEQLADRKRFGPWILQIARRQALRMRRGMQEKIVDIALEPNALAAPAESNGRLDERSCQLLDAVQRLPNHEQVAIVLHYFQAHNVETIARMTGRSIGTVTKQLSRARRRLEQWLRKGNE
jgi:RNA polymerase sigma-70 factor (ECF subfamily)